MGLFQKIDGNATVFLDSLGSPIEKVLGNGEITKKLTVQASAFSASAKEKIVAAGGKYEVV